MISYSERELFCANDIRLLKVAEHLVQKIDERNFDNELRCHEVTRAVGRILELPHQDGHYLFAEHSWLWIGELLPDRADHNQYPPILDVYAVAGLPQVQLFDTFPPLKRVGTVYVPGKERTDIRHAVINELVSQMKSNQNRGSRCNKCGTPTFGRLCGKCLGER